MISHIMLNLRVHSQRRDTMPSGALVKPMSGMSSSNYPSSMGVRSAGMTTVVVSPVTPSAPRPRPRSHPRPPQRPRSMLTETLERFGAPMIDNKEEIEGRHKERTGLPAYAREEPRHVSGPDLRRVSSIALTPLNQARTREIDFP